MNYEKKYKETLERARKWYDSNTNEGYRGIFEDIFPELAESADERIRKELLDFLCDLSKLGKNTNFDRWNKSDCANWIAWLEKQKPINTTPLDWNDYKDKHVDVWNAYIHGKAVGIELGKNAVKNRPEDYGLEKQGEQKPADKVEPKFKVGDWVVWNNHTNCHIDNIYQGEKTLMYTINTNGVLWSNSVKDFDAKAHLWTIKDAKVGDALCIHSSESNFDCIFLYQNTYEIEPNRNVAVAYCCIDVHANKIEFGIQGPDCIDVREVKPATKEQSDLLFQKMKEAGYEWNAEKKELKKIEPKPAWSEEDEDDLNNIIWLCNNCLSKREHT